MPPAVRICNLESSQEETYVDQKPDWRWSAYPSLRDNNCYGVILVCHFVQCLVDLWRRTKEHVELHRAISSGTVSEILLPARSGQVTVRFRHCGKTLRLLHAVAVASNPVTSTVAFKFAAVHYCGRCIESHASTSTAALGPIQAVSDAAEGCIPMISTFDFRSTVSDKYLLMMRKWISRSMYHIINVIRIRYVKNKMDS
jgi:hypothetical protein